MRKNKGFTLIELLVVIAIIGLLSTLAVVSLNSARQKSRDARRVSDVKQIQTALEMYFSDEDTYPIIDPAAAITLGSDNYDCLDDSTAGFVASCGTGNVYMTSVPADPLNNATYLYTYESTSATDGSGYTIKFKLESGAAGLTGTTCTATEELMSCT